MDKCVDMRGAPHVERGHGDGGPAMADQPFAEQHVVVTGGGTGIGRTTALTFAELGAASVVITGRRPDRLAEVAALHPAIVPVTADVSREDGADAVAEAVRERGGHLDVLVHNAGIHLMAPVDSIDIQAARDAFAINVLGPVLLTGRLLPMPAAPGGSL